MIVISCTVRFWQEYRGNAEAVKLQNSSTVSVQVRRPAAASKADENLGVAVDERSLVPGDVIHINPGDSIPADCLLLEASHLQVSQSSLTGESDPLRKTPSVIPEKISPGLFERENLLFMGTSAISGSGLALVLTTGDGAFIATIMKELNKKRPVNAFQKGVRHVSYLMIVFMLIMVPIVSRRLPSFFFHTTNIDLRFSWFLASRLEIGALLPSLQYLSQSVSYRRCFRLLSMQILLVGHMHFRRRRPS